MKKLFAAIFGIFGPTVCAQESSAQSASQFIYVKIPEQIMPVERGRKYAHPLDAFLKSKKVGEVSGGGSQMSAPDQDGKRSIVYVGLDVDLSDFDRGLPLMKSELIRLGVPDGTVLEYARDGVKHSESVK